MRIVKITLLLLTVSLTGTLNDEMFISSHFFPGIERESVKTTLLLHDDSSVQEKMTRSREILFFPFVIEFPVFPSVMMFLVLFLLFGRIEPCKAVVLQEVAGYMGRFVRYGQGEQSIHFFPFPVECLYFPHSLNGQGNQVGG